MNNLSKTIFVGNIPYDYEEQSLLDTLQMVGPINNFRIVLDEETGKPKGYGFCEYKDPEVAFSALKNLKTIDYNGRQLRVNTAENDKQFANLTEDGRKAGKDISYLNTKQNDKLEDCINSMTDDQRVLILQTMKSLSDYNPSAFKELLLNQSEEDLETILNLQNNFKDKNSSTLNKIIN